MKQNILNYQKGVCKLILTGLFAIIGTISMYGQTPPPEGQASQYFCSATSWMNAGFTEPGDTFEELYLYGENLKFYTDAGLSNLIADPSNYVLVDGETYYVTQTIGGVESAALTIDVTDRECGCIKNHSFESLDGQATDDGYTYYEQSINTGHKTCFGSVAGLTSISSGNLDDIAAPAALVSTGDDINVPITSLSRTSPLTATSQFGLRLGNGLNTPIGSLNPTGNTHNGDVAHMTKEFVAGEVFMFNFAAVLNNPSGHPYSQQPYLFVKIYDENDNVIAARCLVSSDTDCIFKVANNNTNSNYTYTLYNEWSCLKINTLGIIGQKARAEFTIADCDQSGHWGYVYIDELFVGDNIDSGCTDPSFGYIAVESVTANTQTLDCVVDIASTAQSCGVQINASVPFPVEVCGTIKTPISNSNPPNIDDLTLTITQNGVNVGTVSNPTIKGDQFCFDIDASDINVSPFGFFEVSSTIDYNLDCGDPYEIVLNDRATMDICPTANCAAPLNTCDNTGTGIGNFDLTQLSPQIRGTWSTADVDITYYESDLEALDQTNAIQTPNSYDNTTPYNQQVYARLDWHPQGTVTNCFYIIAVELNVYNDPIVNLPAVISSCGPGGISEPIVATPTNINNLQNVSYTWERNGVLIPFTGSYYVATQGGTYTVTISEQNCSVTKTVDVEYVDFNVDLGNNLVDLCGSEDDYTITANVINDNSQPGIDLNQVDYVWSTGETSQSIDVSVSGTYSVDVTYKGCTQTNMVDVNIGKRPEVTLNGNQIICANDTAQIVASVSNFNESDVEFTWYLDGGEITGEIQSSIEASQEGTYSVKVNQIGAPDCVNEEVSVDVAHYENAGCVLPQGLSPDTTPGQNDCFDLAFLNDRTGIDNLKIFNRYGRLVFEANNYVDSFCGVDQDGNELVTGTYFYVMELKGEDAIFGKNKKGYIYINRQVN